MERFERFEFADQSWPLNISKLIFKVRAIALKLISSLRKFSYLSSPSASFSLFSNLSHIEKLTLLLAYNLTELTRISGEFLNHFEESNDDDSDSEN